jgi:predicted HicB family RNase H-like nuclease
MIQERLVSVLGELRIRIADQLHEALKLRALKEKKSLKTLVIEILQREIETDRH